MTMMRRSVMSGSSSPLVGWDDVAAVAPDGLAVLDRAGRFVRLNPAAVALCGAGEEAELLGTPGPFALVAGAAAGQAGLLEYRSDEQVAHWMPASGTRREFAYRA